MGIFRKKQQLPPIGNYPGYEASDSAFGNARATVLEVVKSGGTSEWAIIGDAEFIKYLAATKKKLPDREFNFISTQKDLIWDSFSSFLMKPENYGTWNQHIYQEVLEIFISKFSQMPDEYKPKESTWIDAAGLTLNSLDRALKDGHQILAQSIIEYILVIWLHYCLSLDA